MSSAKPLSPVSMFEDNRALITKGWLIVEEIRRTHEEVRILVEESRRRLAISYRLLGREDCGFVQVRRREPQRVMVADASA